MVNRGDGVERGDLARAPSRSRTTLVIDHLLSRGPLLSPSTSETTGRPGASDPWTSVAPVLQAAHGALVANHLSWLVAPVDGEDHGTSSVLVEDQIRILVRALDEGHEHDLLVGALDQDVPMLPNPERHAGFVVLKAADIPSVLVEMGFMSNPRDEAELRRPDHRKLIAMAMKRAVDAFFAARAQMVTAG